MRRRGRSNRINGQIIAHYGGAEAVHSIRSKLFGKMIVSRDTDRRTADIQIRIATIYRFSALGRAKIVAVA